MATQNRIRSLNRLPFEFEDGLTACGIKVGIPSATNLDLSTNKNIVTVIVENTPTTPTVISSDNNIVIILAKNNLVSNSVWITGNNNVVLINETAAALGTVGLRVVGNQNNITGRITGDLLVTGDYNVMNLYVAGATTFASSANNNVLSGVCNGAFSDTGASNDSSGIMGGKTSGVWSVALTAGTGGVFSFSHNCKTPPKSVMITPNTTTARIITVTSITSTAVTVRCFNFDGTPVENATVSFYWYAVI